MKTKKLLAIVTLVAFMMSLLPTALFAVATQFGAIVEEKEITATADNSDYLEYNIFVRSDDGAAFGADQNLTIASSRSGVDFISVDEGTTWTAGVKTVGLSATVASQWVNVRVKSSIPGNVSLAFGLNNDADIEGGNYVENYAQGLNPTTSTATVAKIIGSKLYSASFTTKDADKVILKVVSSNAYANSSSYNEVKAYVTASGIPVSGKDVTFSIDKSGATLSATTVTTNTKGEASTKIFATKAGDYKITAKVDGIDAATDMKTAILFPGEDINYLTADGGAIDVHVDEAVINFKTIGIVSIAAESDNNQKIAKESSGQFSFKFSFKDSNDNTITPTSLLGQYASGNFTSGNLEGAELRVLTEPSGAAVSEKPTSGAANSTTSDLYNIIADGSNLKVTFNKAKFDKEGSYSIRLALANGKSVTYDFNVQKQGTVTGMTVSYDSTSLAGVAADTEATGKPTVKLVDAAGYSTEIAIPAAAVTFASSNPNLATIDNNGIITVKKDAVGSFVVTAMHSDKNLVTTVNFTIQKAAASLKITAPAYTAVGEGSKVTAQLIDVDGNAVTNNTDLASGNVKVIITEKPAGAIVSVDTADVADYKSKGKFTFNVVSNKIGTVKFQVVATPAAISYTGAGSASFGETASAKQALTMFIGAKNYMVGSVAMLGDTTPFIQNGRTFVAARPIGEALGAAIGWNEATQTVTFTKAGEVTTIVIGASTIKVDRAGVVTEYPCDAPAQIVNGRTYLPFRCIGEACGYTVNYDAATGAVSFK